LTERLIFDNEHDFLAKLKELVRGGVHPKCIDIRAPHAVHEVEDILASRPSRVRVFALIGGLLGAFTGYAFTAFTVIDWPLVSGGKPMVAIPPFTVIAFELMVLFGALSAFLGFAIESRMPAIRTIVSDDTVTDDFEIYVQRKG